MVTTPPEPRSLTVRFSAEDNALLEALSKTKDVPAATIVRWALREYAARHLEKPKKSKK